MTYTVAPTCKQQHASTHRQSQINVATLRDTGLQHPHPLWPFFLIGQCGRPLHRVVLRQELSHLAVLKRGHSATQPAQTASDSAVPPTVLRMSSSARVVAVRTDA